MKIDINNIFYIVLMIIVLVVSGLGSRRKKRAQQMKKAAPSSAQPGTQEAEGKAIPGSRLLAFGDMGHDLPRSRWDEMRDAIIDNTRLAS